MANRVMNIDKWIDVMASAESFLIATIFVFVASLAISILFILMANINRKNGLSYKTEIIYTIFFILFGVFVLGLGILKMVMFN
ncbi:hypothetical protein [Staphylococcus capitis]|uniref:hypothetical protein n=1 Tax=Staphylococcus capitis TaxID=29388 RepID=UPI00145AB07A|nr:hypothetical protein [Staphylococcus capitis]NMK69911.1 hypothetical protein [Staphylococcus capitis]